MFNLSHSKKANRRARILSSLTVSLMILVVVAPIEAQTSESKSAQKMTEKDREFAIKNLKASRERFLTAIDGLSEAQLKFKSAPDRWSIAEVAEHITLSEDFFMDLITNQVLRSPVMPDKERKVTDEALLALMTDRSNRAQAPEPVAPKNKWQSVKETMKEFEKRRSRTIEFVKITTDDLRSHFSPFGNRGEIDALQWVLLISAHCDRHVAQINEVKAAANFPKKAF
jgi:DinB family protein